MKKCIKCMNEINPLRLKALQNTKTCVQCSDTQRVYAHTIISGKNTYSEIQLVSEETSAMLYKLGHRVGQGVSKGVRFKFDPKNK